MTPSKLNRPLLGLALAALCASACVAKPAYECSSNAQCIAEGTGQGVCLPDNHCAYPDKSCSETGLRYSPSAGSLASSCAPKNPSGNCVSQVTLGIDFTCALKTDGSVWCWGVDDHGQLGDGQPAGAFSVKPRRVALPAGVVATQIGAGEVHACALSSNGGVWCWGGGASQQLGLGSDDNTDHLTPVQAVFPSEVLPVHSLAVGAAHNCAVGRLGAVCVGEKTTITNLVKIPKLPALKAAPPSPARTCHCRHQSRNQSTHGTSCRAMSIRAPSMT